MPELICISGTNKGEDYELSDGEFTIGRTEGNSITCADAKASRTHCRLVCEGETLMIEDCQSTNGTRVNNVYLTGPRPLQHGDHIQIGQTLFVVKLPHTMQVFDPVNMPDASVFTMTHTSAIRRAQMTRENHNLGCISYAVAPKR